MKSKSFTNFLVSGRIKFMKFFLASQGAILSILIACFFWAGSFIATKTALQGTGPMSVVALRHIVASICFAIWLYIRRKSPKAAFPRLSFRFIFNLFLLSLFSVTLHHAFQTTGLQYTSAANASVFAATCPVFILILGFLFLKEKISFLKFLGIVLAILGVFFLMGWESLKSFSFGDRLKGDLLVLGSIAMWALFTVIGKKTVEGLSPFRLMAWVTFLGTFCLLPFLWNEQWRDGFSILRIPFSSWGAIIFLGVTCSFLANLLYLVALKQMESQKVGVFLYLIPPMTSLMAVGYLHEPITLNLMGGMFLVLVGVALTEKG